MQESLFNVVSLAGSSFIESVDLVVMLDSKSIKNSIKGVIDLPHGSGREVKVAVLAKGDDAKMATDAGADYVGEEDLVQKVLNDTTIQFDWFLSTPDLMPLAARLSKVLGPRNLMPNPKIGTVTKSLTDAVDKIKSGRIRFKSDNCGLIHLKIGNIKFSIGHLEENLKECLSVIKALRVENKLVVVKKAYLSTTMSGGSIKLNIE
ncbi:MAG: 50S ribosomal protein L1 [Rickettsiaceae bacterium H1]|nr:50S ribosomal protein L1 [Rickettsiaceae bacterium H1]